MKMLLSAILLVASGTACAVDEQQQTGAAYINYLCSIAIQEPNASADVYLEKMKSMSAHGGESSAQNNDAFDQETAEEVINSWQSLSAEQREQVKSSDGCQQILASEFQQAD